MPQGAITMSEADINAQIIELIEQSGILKPGLTLNDVIELGKKVSKGQGGISPDSVDYFIHRNFVVTHVD